MAPGTSRGVAVRWRGNLRRGWGSGATSESYLNKSDVHRTNGEALTFLIFNHQAFMNVSIQFSFGVGSYLNFNFNNSK